MELQEYFFIIRKRFILIVIITLLATLTSAILSYFVISPTYKADISVIIGKSEDTTKAPNQSYNDIMMYQQLVKTYSELAVSRTVAEDVITKLNLNMTPNQLIPMITVTPKSNTEFLTITVKSKKPDEAMNIANQLAKSLKDVSAIVQKSDNVMLLDQAQLPTGADSPRPKLNMAIAFFIGLMVSIGIVFLMEYLDNTVKTPEDLEKLLELPVIGIIPLVEEVE